MSQFLESICFQSGGYQQLTFHQKRLDDTFHNFFPNSVPYKLDSILPALSGAQKRKVRVVYDEGHFEIDIHDYKPKVISKLKLLEVNDLDYSFKYTDRSTLDQLIVLGGDANDILIVQNGKITDSSYANVIFWDGKAWNTPDTYLLNGTKRQKLLHQGIINETEIREKDLKRYTKVGLINAMLDPGELTLPISGISR